MEARARLVASRPQAAAYARALAALPATLVGAEGRVAELAIHPVKGFGAVRLPRLRVERRGLVDPGSGLADRGVVLAYRRPGTTAEGVPFDAIGIANRNEASVARVRASLDSGSLLYEAPGLPPLRLDPAALAPGEGERLRVKLPYDGGPVIEGVLDEGPLGGWARDLFRANPARRRFAIDDVVAVRPAPDHLRAVADRHRAGEEAETLFGDGAHALVASEATLAWMNAALAASGQRTIGMEAFRPNVVLSGLPPNAEDVVRDAEILAAAGPVPVVFASLCVRCDATRIDYATGTRPDAQPLAWLARERPGREDSPAGATFAINAVFPSRANGSVVRVGDALRVARER